MMEAKRSIVWNYFTEESNNSAKCSLCSKSYSTTGRGTTALKNHLRSMHEKEFKDAITEETRKKDEKQQEKTVTQQMKSDIKQRNVSEFFRSTKYWDCSENKSKSMDKRIAEMIIIDNLPFSHVEDLGFMRLMAEALPQYKLKQRNFYSSIICNEIYESVFNKTKNIFDDIKKKR